MHSVTGDLDKGEFEKGVAKAVFKYCKISTRAVADRVGEDHRDLPSVSKADDVVRVSESFSIGLLGSFPIGLHLGAVDEVGVAIGPRDEGGVIL